MNTPTAIDVLIAFGKIALFLGAGLIGTLIISGLWLWHHDDLDDIWNDE